MNMPRAAALLLLLALQALACSAAVPLHVQEPTNECVDDKNMTATEAFADDLLSCGQSEFLNPWGNAKSVAICLANKFPAAAPSISCLGCFGANVVCGWHTCEGSCLGGARSDACVDCAMKYCLYGLYVCTGAKGPEELPPAPNGKVYPKPDGPPPSLPAAGARLEAV
mmetsp:Transcript_28709/g.71122  ORF Transcript_28709/g.71122 Transcript_28709/m.71122 type:complete len:168 (+) Transcript_28709:46-549(+)